MGRTRLNPIKKIQNAINDYYSVKQENTKKNRFNKLIQILNSLNWKLVDNTISINNAENEEIILSKEITEDILKIINERMSIFYASLEDFFSQIINQKRRELYNVGDLNFEEGIIDNFHIDIQNTFKKTPYAIEVLEKGIELDNPNPILETLENEYGISFDFENEFIIISGIKSVDLPENLIEKVQQLGLYYQNDSEISKIIKMVQMNILSNMFEALKGTQFTKSELEKKSIVAQDIPNYKLEVDSFGSMFVIIENKKYFLPLAFSRKVLSLGALQDEQRIMKHIESFLPEILENLINLKNENELDEYKTYCGILFSQLNDDEISTKYFAGKYTVTSKKSNKSIQLSTEYADFLGELEDNLFSDILATEKWNNPNTAVSDINTRYYNSLYQLIELGYTVEIAKNNKGEVIDNKITFITPTGRKISVNANVLGNISLDKIEMKRKDGKYVVSQTRIKKVQDIMNYINTTLVPYMNDVSSKGNLEDFLKAKRKLIEEIKNNKEFTTRYVNGIFFVSKDGFEVELTDEQSGKIIGIEKALFKQIYLNYIHINGSYKMDSYEMDNRPSNAFKDLLTLGYSIKIKNLTNDPEFILIDPLGAEINLEQDYFEGISMIGLPFEKIKKGENINYLLGGKKSINSIEAQQRIMDEFNKKLAPIILEFIKNISISSNWDIGLLNIEIFFNEFSRFIKSNDFSIITSNKKMAIQDNASKEKVYVTEFQGNIMYFMEKCFTTPDFLHRISTEVEKEINQKILGESEDTTLQERTKITSADLSYKKYKALKDLGVNFDIQNTEEGTTILVRFPWNTCQEIDSYIFQDLKLPHTPEMLKDYEEYFQYCKKTDNPKEFSDFIVNKALKEDKAKEIAKAPGRIIRKAKENAGNYTRKVKGNILKVVLGAINKVAGHLSQQNAEYLMLVAGELQASLNNGEFYDNGELDEVTGKRAGEIVDGKITEVLALPMDEGQILALPMKDETEIGANPEGVDKND